MRAAFDRELLVQALAGVAGVVPQRSPKQCLAGVMLTVDADGAIVEATDLEVWVRRRVAHGVKAEAAGRAVLPMPRLLDALRKCDDAEASIEADEARAVVKVGRSTFTMQTHDPMEWPSNGDQWARLESPAFRVAAADLRKAFARTEHCTDPTSTNWAIGGLRMELADGSLDVVGFDGRKMAWQRCPAMPGVDGAWPEPAPVVPVSAAGLLRKNAEDDDAVDISADAAAVLFRWRSASVLCRRMEGVFPSWRDKTPSRAGTTARFDAAGRLARLIDRASVMTTPLTNGITLAVGGGEMVASAITPDLGHSEAAEPCEVDGPGETVTLQQQHAIGLIRPLDRDAPVLVLANPKWMAFRTEDGFFGAAAGLHPDFQRKA